MFGVGGAFAESTRATVSVPLYIEQAQGFHLNHRQRLLHALDLNRIEVFKTVIRLRGVGLHARSDENEPSCQLFREREYALSFCTLGFLTLRRRELFDLSLKRFPALGQLLKRGVQTDFREQDLPRTSGSTEAGTEIHRRTEHGVVLAHLTADVAEHHVSGIDADATVRHELAGSAVVRLQFVHPVDLRTCRCNRTKRVVAVIARGSVKCHDLVADDFIYRCLVIFNRRHHGSEVVVNGGAHFLRLHLF